jgi:hypothetical protein
MEIANYSAPHSGNEPVGLGGVRFMKNKLLLFMMILIPAMIFAGTAFETEKKTSDPYIADNGGFESLFVNPAGAAGISEFQVAIEAGTSGKLSDYKAIRSLGEMAKGMSSDDLSSSDMESAAETLADLVDSGQIEPDTLDELLAGTSIAGTISDYTDADALADAFSGLSESDLEQIATNYENDSPENGGDDSISNDVQDIEIKVNATATARVGFLIKGFGLGIYDHAMAVASVADMGFEEVYDEAGAIAGFGINILNDKLSVGASGNFSMLGQADNLSIEDMDAFYDSTPIHYGYSWGVDAGAIWHMSPALNLGLVFNDIIGCTQYDYPYSDTMANIVDGGLNPPSDYKFTMDMDMGISWKPNWRFVQPKLSADFYDLIGFVADYEDDGYSWEEALSQLRLGANVTFFKFLNIGTQYYDHDLALGAGLDLLFLELYGQVKVADTIFYDWSDKQNVGADLLVKIHFGGPK